MYQVDLGYTDNEQAALRKEAVEVPDVDLVASDKAIRWVVNLRTITEDQILGGFEHGPAPEGRRSSVLKHGTFYFAVTMPTMRGAMPLHAYHVVVCARSFLPSQIQRIKLCQIDKILQDPCWYTFSSRRSACTDHKCSSQDWATRCHLVTQQCPLQIYSWWSYSRSSMTRCRAWDQSTCRLWWICA